MNSRQITHLIAEVLYYKFERPFSEKELNEEIGFCAGSDSRTIRKYKQLLYDLDYLEEIDKDSYQIKEEPKKPLTPSEYRDKIKSERIKERLKKDEENEWII